MLSVFFEICFRKTVVKKEIKRVTSGSAGDCIPADEYSWKKYDQKLVPGTVFPRYYSVPSVTESSRVRVSFTELIYIKQILIKMKLQGLLQMQYIQGMSRTKTSGENEQ